MAQLKMPQPLVARGFEEEQSEAALFCISQNMFVLFGFLHFVNSNPSFFVEEPDVRIRRGLHCVHLESIAYRGFNTWMRACARLI